MSAPPPAPLFQPPVADLFGGCRAPAGFYDEAFTQAGQPREHWRDLLGGLNALGKNELAARWENGRRILRNHGVTYNAADGSRDNERPWELDLAPFTLSAQEWSFIERGAIQRARLQNLLLNDIYNGPQRLLRDGFIPPALLYANPNFLRACRGIPAPKGIYLHLAAIDLARSPSGEWWALGDRLQAPGGIGYVLENRTIVSRLLPREFRSLQVQRLNSFFSAFRQTLTELAPSATMWPRIVLLTPGIHSPAHYEHSLLARHLGFALVEGGDLTVRDQRVFLKTVEGPQRVDVIVRQVNDAMCDPLELRADSCLGVPGLVQAARAGNVLVANALGSAAAETPSFIPSLPLLCRHLMDEDLMIPSTATWWCGEASDRNHVLANLKSLIIKRAFPTRQRETQSGKELNQIERDELRARIERRPHSFIGQVPVPLSHAPVWANGRFESRPVALRVYVAARGDSYIALPGGLTKVSQSSLNPVSGLQIGGGSKDTWILGANESPQIQEPIRFESRAAERMLTGAPSRIADNLFWLGRYSERLEHTTHILRAISSRLLDEFESRTLEQIAALTRVMSAIGLCPKPPAGPFNPATAEHAVLNLVYDPAASGGISQLIGNINVLVSSARDRFSGDTWRIISRLRDFPGPRPPSLPLTNAQSLIHELIANLAALSGMELESMTRGVEWRFLDFGRRLERAHCLCRLFQAALSPASQTGALLNPILEICDSSMTYRRQYFSQPEFGSVLSLLIRDKTNPRALRFQLGVMTAHLRAISRKSDSREEIDQMTLIDKEISPERLRKLSFMLNKGESTEPAEFFGNLAQRLGGVCDTLAHRYFALVPPRINSGGGRGA